MTAKQDQILAALQKLGPSSPTALANSLGGEPSAIGFHLRKMLIAGTVKAAGISMDRRYALPDQPLDGAMVASKKTKQKKTVRKPPKRRAIHRRKKHSKRTAAERVVSPTVLPAIASGRRLVMFRTGEAPQIYTREQTLEIATVMLENFDA